MRTEISSTVYFMDGHDQGCGGEFETERDDVSGICIECKDHCGIIVLGCDCGEIAEEVSSCCGSKVYNP